MMMAAANGGEDGNYNAEESKYDEQFDDGSAIDGSSAIKHEGEENSSRGDDADFTKRDSSRVSNRALVDKNFRFQRKKKRGGDAVDE